MPEPTEDEQVRADMKQLLALYYRELLRGGKRWDEALDLTAEEERRMRLDWEAAKAADGR